MFVFGTTTILFACGIIALLILWMTWSIKLGFVRGSLSVLCRLGWITPVFLAFFPETTAVKIPKSLSIEPIHVLIDDSQSMQNTSTKKQWQPVLDELEKRCERLGCAVKLSRLSDLQPAVGSEYTPLSDAMEPWLYSIGLEPWLLISDGGDWYPRLPWEPGLSGLGLRQRIQMEQRGLILGVEHNQKQNIWLENVDVPPVSFQDSPVNIKLRIHRRQVSEQSQRVQVQVFSGDHSIGGFNAEFIDDDRQAALSMVIPPLGRGQHLLTIKVLPTANENSLWDNEENVQIEIMPNTLGVLHLLGAPSWDGRFF